MGDTRFRPIREPFAALRNGKGLEQLLIELRQLAPALIVRVSHHSA
jgi:hypothetical protein